jgi:hypothetical protein
MSEPVCIQMELTIANRIKIALEDGLESAEELLASHDAMLGRTTRKNQATAKFYEAQIAEFNQLIEMLPDS